VIDRLPGGYDAAGGLGRTFGKVNGRHPNQNARTVILVRSILAGSDGNGANDCHFSKSTGYELIFLQCPESIGQHTSSISKHIACILILTRKKGGLWIGGNASCCTQLLRL